MDSKQRQGSGVDVLSDAMKPTLRSDLAGRLAAEGTPGFLDLFRCGNKKELGACAQARREQAEHRNIINLSA